MCGQKNENMLHMLTCDKYPQCFITDIIQEIPDLNTLWEWLFHYERPPEIRIPTSRWIHNRWRAREQSILRTHDNAQNGIGINPAIPTLGTGTEVGRGNPKNPRGNPAPQLRRGPKRTCRVNMTYQE